MRQHRPFCTRPPFCCYPLLSDRTSSRSQPPAVTNGRSRALQAVAGRPQKGRTTAHGQFGGRRGMPAGVYKSQITPHWFANNTPLAVPQRPQGTGHGIHRGRLPSAASAARRSTLPSSPRRSHERPGTEYKAEKLPFDTIEFVNDTKCGPVHRRRVGLDLRPAELRMLQVRKQAGDAASPARRGAGD